MQSGKTITVTFACQNEIVAAVYDRRPVRTEQFHFAPAASLEKTEDEK